MESAFSGGPAAADGWIFRIDRSACRSVLRCFGSSYMAQGLFLSGMLALYLAQGGPVSLLGHIFFSFHMVSMALSYLVAVPLIMLGIPDWLWRTFLKVNPLRRFAFLAQPVVAALLFNGLFSLYHIPVVHDYVMLHFTVHRLYYGLLFLTSVLMWWNLINPLPEYRKLGGLGQVGFIFLNMVLLTPACGLIILRGLHYMPRTVIPTPGHGRWATVYREIPLHCCRRSAVRRSSDGCRPRSISRWGHRHEVHSGIYFCLDACLCVLSLV